MVNGEWLVALTIGNFLVEKEFRLDG